MVAAGLRSGGAPPAHGATEKQEKIMVAMWMAELERSLASLDRPYGWIITRDRNYEIAQAHQEAGLEPLDNDPCQVGKIGPKTIPAEIEKLLKEGKGTPFRLVDQGDLDTYNDNTAGAVAEGHPDYGVIYEGRLIDPTESWDFGPLNDFGAYIAVGIQYRNEATGEWRDL
jgi:hypothetical protein